MAEEFFVKLSPVEGRTEVCYPDGVVIGAASWGRMLLDNALARLREMDRLSAVVREERKSHLLAAGELLFKALFSGDLGVVTEDCLCEILTGKEKPVQLVFSTQGAEGQGLPYEVIRSPRLGVWGASQGLTLVRRITGAKLRGRQSATPPLRILLMVSSPYLEMGRRPLLDFEREEALIIRALQPLLRSGVATLRVLETGTLEELRDALVDGDFNVLHYTGHADGESLLLENATGEPVHTDQKAFSQVVLACSSMRLVVLSACATAGRGTALGAFGEGSEFQNGAPLPNIAAGLAASGIDYVVGMQGSVSDETAIRWANEFYSALALGVHSDVPAAIQKSRAALYEMSSYPDSLISGNRSGIAFPVLYQQTSRRLLLVAGEEVAKDSLVKMPSGDRPRGRFVGRRRLQQNLLRQLRGTAVGGVVLYGIGGIGKTAMARRLAKLLSRDNEFYPLFCSEIPVSAGRLIIEIQDFLENLESIPGQVEIRGVCRSALRYLGHDSVLSLDGQLDMLVRDVFRRIPVLLVLDNLEAALAANDEGHWELRDSVLAKFFADLLNRPGSSRLLLLTRYLFSIPSIEDGRLSHQMIGPLDKVEARKLMLGFPSLRHHQAGQLLKIESYLGGHPRSIEYLAALLEGGKVKWSDVEGVVDAALNEGGVNADNLFDLEPAIRIASIKAAQDILLGQLLDGLSSEGLEFLQRLSVYRNSVEPRVIVGGLQGADLKDEVAQLEKASLLYRSHDGGQARVKVHRVTAQAIHDDIPAQELQKLHRLAAAHYKEVAVDQGVWSLLEARWHLLQAKEIEEAAAVAFSVEDVLQKWGYWEQAEQLNQETWQMEELSKSIRAQAAHNLGYCSQLKGDYARASEYYHLALSLWVELGDDRGTAATYHHLGILEQEVGDSSAAISYYEKSLELDEMLQNYPGVASSHGQLGVLFQLMNRPEEAKVHLERSLRIAEELDQKPQVAANLHQLGMLAQDQGNYSEARSLLQQAVSVNEADNDRVGLASSYHQLALLAQLQNDYRAAQDLYEKSLEISEELGDRFGIATTYHQLGTLAQLRRDLGESYRLYEKALVISDDLGDRTGMAAGYQQLGLLAQIQGDFAEARSLYERSLRLKEELGDRHGIALSLFQLGVLSQLSLDLSRARMFYESAVSSFELLGDEAGQARSIYQLGVLAQEEGDESLAKELIDQSLAIDERIGNRFGVASAQHQLAKLEESANPDRALRYYLQSLSSLRDLGHPEVETAVRSVRRFAKKLGADQFLKIWVRENGALPLPEWISSTAVRSSCGDYRVGHSKAITRSLYLGLETCR